MRFVSLHHHTTLSYRDGYGLPEAHIRRAQELQMPAIAMTEHGNTDSHVKAEIAADGTGVKVIYGCEIYFGPTDEDHRTQTKTHLTVLAKNQTGYINLLALVTKSFSEGFYYEATVSPEMLLKHKEGLIILSGCQGSLLFCSALGGKHIAPEDASYHRALKVARWFKKNFGDDYFIETQAFPELEPTCRFNRNFAGRLARAVGARLVGTMDCHYTDYEDSEMQMILHNLRGGNKKTIEEQAREWGYNVPLCPPPDDKSIYRRLRRTGLSDAEAIQACVSTEDIAQECTVELPKLPMVRFMVPAPFGSTQDYWEQALRDGWMFRGINKLPASERARYKKQLVHEKSLIESKDYIDYFLIVREGVLFVKDTLKEPVGPARGSAAASVAAWLLRITEVDPLKFPLLVFERFIDETREDLPDIDLDFPSEVRPKLRDYYAGKYGDECVNNIGTFTYFKNKLALDDVARVFRVPKFEVEKIKDFLIERSSGDLRSSSTIEDTIEQFPQAKEVMDKFPELYKSRHLEGNIKSFGVHAAGIVISNAPLREVAAIKQRVVNGHPIQVVGLDKYDAERQGLVKMDFLGLSTMSMISSALHHMDMKIDDLYALPLNDAKVYDGFRNNDVVGVFQFDGRAMRYVCGSMKPDNFSEICDCNALARPGPLHNGAASEYAEIKHGVKLADKFHPAVDVITAPTQYQIVYQEQILRIVREVGDFPWTHAAYIRKIISRKIGEQEFNRQWDRFWEGCQTLHERTDYPPISLSQAKKVWGSMITSGSYAFNAAHCVAYGLLAYWTMWFKVHHPAIFYACSLAQYDENPDKTRQLLRDAVKHGIDIQSPDPNVSQATWEPAEVRGADKPLAVQSGFKQIHGVGDKVAQSIVNLRDESGTLDGWWDLLEIRGVGPKTVDKIEGWVLQKDPFGVNTLDQNIAKVKKLIKRKKLKREDGRRLPTPTHVASDLPYEQGREFSVCWLGTILQRNIRDIFETNRAKTGEELDPSSVRNPELNEWALLTCEDEDDQLLLKIDRWKYPDFKEAIFDFKMGQDLLLVEGIRPRYVTARQILAKRLWTIEM
jgi:DNA polymerase-3 subunit alpha